MCMAVGVRMQGIMLLNVILPHARSPKPEQQDVVEGSAVFSLVLISSFNVFHCDKTWKPPRRSGDQKRSKDRD